MKKLILCLLIPICGFGQSNDFIAGLKKKSDNYFAKYKRAKLQLFFNQPKYASGDTIRFKTSYLRAADLQPVMGREIVHVCLFDQLGKKQLVRWYRVENG